MHFFGIFSLSFLLAGANAGVLEQPGYTFQDLGDGTCTTTKQSFDGSQQPVTFEVSKTDKSMTVKHLNIVGNNNDPYQLSTSRIMAAVCRKCDLEPDNLTKVVMTVPTDDCLKRVLDVYRSLHDLEKNEKIVTTLALRKTYPDTDREVWLDLRYCPSPEIVYGMLTPASIVSKIYIEEGDVTCSISYFIRPYMADDRSRICNADGYTERYGDNWMRESCRV